MNIEIIEDSLRADAITHSGRFHADDVFATAILYLLFTLKPGNEGKPFKVFRTNEFSSSTQHSGVVYDIGGGKYDHHQVGGNGKHSCGVSYAAFGLLWRDFGYALVCQYTKCDEPYLIKKVCSTIEYSTVCSVDAHDNGEQPYVGNLGYSVATLSQVISNMVPFSEDIADVDTAFTCAVEFAVSQLEMLISKTMKSISSQTYVLKQIDNSSRTDGILVLNKHVPFISAVFKHPNGKSILFVVYPSERNQGYNVMTMQIAPGNFTPRVPFPQSWAGLSGKALQNVTHVSTAIFCHKNCFIASASTLEDAVKLAQEAIKSNEKK